MLLSLHFCDRLSKPTEGLDIDFTEFVFHPNKQYCGLSSRGELCGSGVAGSRASRRRHECLAQLLNSLQLQRIIPHIRGGLNSVCLVTNSCNIKHYVPPAILKMAVPLRDISYCWLSRSSCVNSYSFRSNSN